MQRFHLSIFVLLISSIHIYLISMEREEYQYLYTIPLHQAILDGNIDTISNVELNKYINCQDAESWNPLHHAAYLGNESITRILVNIPGIKVNAQTRNGYTPLHLASGQGHNKIVQILCALSDIDVNIQNTQENNYTALHYAVIWQKEQAVKELINTPKININIQDQYQMTPLQKAIVDDNMSIVELLLNCDGVSLEEADGIKLLERAIYYGKAAIIKQLLKFTNININTLNSSNQTIFYTACQWGHTEVVQAIIDSPKFDPNLNHIDNMNAFYSAVCADNVELVKQLLRISLIDPNIPLNADRTIPLHLAVGLNHENVVNILLEFPEINIEVRDDRGWTPLHCAAYYGHEVPLKKLLNAGASARAQDKAGNTPLQIAIENCQEVIISILSEYNKLPSNCLHHAISNNNIDELHSLLQCGANVNARDEYGFTSLHRAVAKGDEKLVKILLAIPHTKINAQENTGCTPLHLAAYLGKESLIVHLLGFNGIKINIQNNDHWTPLHCAISRAQKNVIKQLLSVNTLDLSIKNDEGFTPLEMAYKKGNNDIIKLLEARDIATKTITYNPNSLEKEIHNQKNSLNQKNIIFCSSLKPCESTIDIVTKKEKEIE